MSNITEKIMKIMSLTMAINPPEHKDKNKPDVFIDWQSHCNSFTMRVFLDGWIPYSSPDFTAIAYTNCQSADEELDRMIEYLEGILSDDIKPKPRDTIILTDKDGVRFEILPDFIKWVKVIGDKQYIVCTNGTETEIKESAEAVTKLIAKKGAVKNDRN